jgi:hypothetical protein
MFTRIALVVALGASGLLAQRGGGGSLGAPMGGGPAVSGPRLGATVPMGGTAASSLGMGASMLPPPVPPPMPRGGGRRGYGGRGYGYGGYGGYGGYVLPVPVYGGFDSFYGSVHNPPPGTYDPIFGVYSPYPTAIGMAPGYEQPAPSVVINQNFQAETARPVMHDYTNANLRQPGPDTTDAGQAPQVIAAPRPTQNEPQFYFLIATKDSTIHAAAAYWVTGDMLNFMTLQGVRDRVPLNQVDRELSKKLNSSRAMEFELPQ